MQSGGKAIVDRPWETIAAPDPNREYLALLSYLPLKSYRKTLDLTRRAGQVAGQLADTSGLIGFTFRAKILGHRFWTLSVWEDEDALMAFVGKDRPPYRPVGNVNYYRRDDIDAWAVARIESRPVVDHVR